MCWQFLSRKLQLIAMLKGKILLILTLFSVIWCYYRKVKAFFHHSRWKIFLKMSLSDLLRFGIGIILDCLVLDCSPNADDRNTYYCHYSHTDKHYSDSRSCQCDHPRYGRCAK